MTVEFTNEDRVKFVDEPDVISWRAIMERVRDRTSNSIHDILIPINSDTIDFVTAIGVGES